MAETIYVLDVRAYNHWTDMERDQAHAFIAAHGIDNKRVALNGHLRVERETDGTLTLSTWAYDHNTAGQIVVENGHPVGRTHRIPLRVAPPIIPGATTVHEAFTAPDGVSVERPIQV